MLIVAALISLFAGLALFSVQSALEQNKQKAAVAECRQIATAVGFAYQDMGFFPKLAFLRFNSTNLLQFLTPSPTTLVNGLEANSYFVGNLENRIVKNWKGIYSALNQQRLVRMQFESAVETVNNPGIPSGTATLVVDWPADPWGNPYTLYLVKTLPADINNPNPRESFLENSGDRPNYFAGIVSYGRNGVPGLGDEPPPVERTARIPLRMYEQIDPLNFRLLNPSELTQGRLDMIINSATPDPLRPRIREVGSDDRYAEF
jgi:hypothetical protein